MISEIEIKIFGAILGIAIGASLSSLYLVFCLFRTVRRWTDRVIPVVVEYEVRKNAWKERQNLTPKGTEQMFIKLTLKTGGDLYINPQYIASMQRHNNDTHPNDKFSGSVTFLDVGNEASGWRIVETPEEILQLIIEARKTETLFDKETE